jgi:hypothetical protein
MQIIIFVLFYYYLIINGLGPIIYIPQYNSRIITPTEKKNETRLFIFYISIQTIIGILLGCASIILISLDKHSSI